MQAISVKTGCAKSSGIRTNRTLPSPGGANAPGFFHMRRVKPMTDKITADAMTRATQIATNAMKSKWRTKAASFQIFAPATTARRLATTSATIQKIVERAIAEV